MLIKFNKTGTMEVCQGSICTWNRRDKTLTIENPNEFKEFTGDNAYFVLKQLEQYRIPVSRKGRV